MKKIIIFSNDTTYTYNLRDVLIKSFVKNDYDVVVVCECLNNAEKIRNLGASIIDIKFRRRSKNPLSDLSLFARFLKVLIQEKPDSVFSYNIKPNVYGGIACKLMKVPYIPNITGLGTAVHNNGLIQRVSKMLYKIGISDATCVMFQNRENMRFFLEHRLINKRSRICLLPGSGVNLERFSYQEYPHPSSRIVFSTIGRIMKDKGINELLEAIKKVKRIYHDICFRVIGYFDENYRTIVTNAVEDKLVELVEEQEDILPYIIESWAIIQPSHHEGMSNVLLESAATGRPVIATNIPGCIETFDNEISGLSFPVGDADALAETIIRFIKLPYERKVMMGRMGRKKMEREFDRSIVAQTYIKEIKKDEEEK